MKYKMKESGATYLSDGSRVTYEKGDVLDVKSGELDHVKSEKQSTKSTKKSSKSE